MLDKIIIRCIVLCVAVIYSFGEVSAGITFIPEVRWSKRQQTTIQAPRTAAPMRVNWEGSDFEDVEVFSSNRLGSRLPKKPRETKLVNRAKKSLLRERVAQRDTKSRGPVGGDKSKTSDRCVYVFTLLSPPTTGATVSRDAGFFLFSF